MSNSLVYQIKDATWALEFSASALAHLQSHVQSSRWSKESVGQLYSRDLTRNRVVIDVATTLKPTRSSYAKVVFDPRKADDERERFFAQGLHCVGLWHSHPEKIPTPSTEDKLLAKEHADAARNNLNALLFVILGNAPFPEGLSVWLHDGRDLWKAEHCTELNPRC